MKRLVLINKPVGLTPLQAVLRFKELHPEYKDAKVSYAGRLDPMAEGLLLLLINDENKKRKDYEDLAKTYEFSMLLGIATDTYDLMGKITDMSFDFPIDDTIHTLKSLLPHFLGSQTLPYPPYSSKTVNGIPLYKYARENRLGEITLPKRHVTVTSFELISPHPTLLPQEELLSYISRIIPYVQGEFRQNEIVHMWNDHSSLFPSQLHLLSFRITCSSGTYVRGIVHALGEKLSLPTVTYSIKRTTVGSFKLEDVLSENSQKGKDETNNNSQDKHALESSKSENTKKR